MGVADRLLLQVANRRRLSADVTRAVQSVERTGSMEAKPGLTVTIADPRDRLMESSILTRRAMRALGTAAASTLRPIDLLLDGVWYRLQQANRVGDHVGLTFDHRGAVYMGQHDDPLSASRNDTTRALFIRRQVDEVARKRGAGHKLAFWAWEVRRRMPIAASTEEISPRAEPDRDVDATRERSKGAKHLKVKGHEVDDEQRRNMAIAAEVADEVDAGPKATLALFCAGIGESDFRNVPNSEGSPYGGVWQARKTLGLTTAQQARSFLLGGNGFQAGGAIDLARKSPGLTPGEIATKVEASGKPGEFYNQHRDEAALAIDALGGVATSASGGGSYVKGYRFVRARGEDAWESTGKLAEEVGRRRFITVPQRGSDLFVYAADADLLRLRSQARLSFDGAYVLGEPEYDLDYGKTVRSMRMQVRGSAFDADFAWGLPVTVDDAGPASGKWLVWDVHEVDGSPVVDLELRQPQPSKAEPAAERVQRSDGSFADTDGSAAGMAFARAKAISERNYPYVWGGGHSRAGKPDGGTGRDPGTGFDCSGYVCACLDAGGMLPGHTVLASGPLMSWGAPGKGDKLTVWANSQHTFIEFHIGGKRRWADTSRQAGGPSGPHVRSGDRTTAGFTARHWPGEGGEPGDSDSPTRPLPENVSKHRSGN